MRKFIVLPMVFILCAVMVAPAFAFTSESFVVDTDDYLFNSIQANSFSLRNSASTYSVSAASEPTSTSPDFLLDSSPSMDVMVGGIIGGPVLDSPFSDIYTVTPVFSWSGSNNNVAIWLARNAFTWKPKEDQSYKSLVLSMVSFRLTLDSLNADSISFSGALRPRSLCWSPYSFSTFFSDCVIYVNGDKVHSLSANSSGFFEFNDYIYSSSSTPITSVAMEFTGGGSFNLSRDVTSVTPTFQASLQSYDRIDFKFSVLSEDAVLNGFNDKAQDDINQHESYEADYTSSMNTAFDALSLDSFVWHDGLISAFSLISGIFSDLWNGMGIYAVLYTFPLFLAIVLLLIGRISKFAGTKSSGKNGDE